MAIFEQYLWLFPLGSALFGLIIGSFLNVVIHRLPIMMERQWRLDCADTFPESGLAKPEGQFNLSQPCSHCTQCKKSIKIIDNIPIVSWLVLKGRCRSCLASISWRYPFVELISALLSLFTAIQFGPNIYCFAALIFLYALITLLFIDLDTMLLPDQITLPLMWLGIALSLMEISPTSLQDSVLGAIFGYLSLWSVYWMFKLATGKEGMGYGDFKLLAALGAWLGWQYLPMIILCSSIVGVFMAIIQLALKGKALNQAFPFGPYLAISGWIALTWGDEILNWYIAQFWGL